jgi:tetratricopeptide (TPR) repeat protein
MVDHDVRRETRARRDAHTAMDDLPAERVVVGDIPQLQPGFQPRADLEAELDLAGQGVSVLLASGGMQGVGKTQLAAAYTWAKVEEGWPLVAWVNAENAGSLQAGLAAAAEAAGLSGGGAGREGGDAGRALRHRLEADGDRCLVVFADASEPDLLRPYIPVAGAARVLITSTRQPVAGLGVSVVVDAFTAEQALAFLIGQTGLADDTGAAAVAAELGNLPLAVAAAAAVIAGQHLTYGAYLERLRAAAPATSEVGADRYPRGVAEAVLLSLRAVRTADWTGVCTGAMEILAVLSAAGVRRELFHAAGEAGTLAGGGHQVAADLVDRALDQLADWSLVAFSLDGQAVIAHRLVTQVVRDELVRQRRLTAPCRAAASLLQARARELKGVEDRQLVRDLAEQVTALDKTARLLGTVDKELEGVLLRVRFLALYYLIELGNGAPQAIAVGEPLAADLERVQGPDHLDTLNARNSLAAAYCDAGLAAEAIPLFERTMDGRERLLGAEHPDTLVSQNNLAAAYQDAGRAAEAVVLFERTLAVRERVLGRNHPVTLNSVGNLAGAYRDAGRAAEAIVLFERTLAGRERQLGAEHPDTLRSRNNLAGAYRDAGRPADAIPLFEKNLVAYERLLGAHHPRTQASLHSLKLARQEAARADALRNETNGSGRWQFPG